MGRQAIKLIIFGLALNAIWNVAPPFWRYAKFQDAVLETAKLSSRLSRQDVLAKVMVLADQHRVPLAPEHVVVVKEQQRTAIRATYVVDLKYLPYRSYPYRFDIDVQGTPPRLTELP
jgi:hypothetical protein